MSLSRRSLLTGLLAGGAALCFLPSLAHAAVTRTTFDLPVKDRVSKVTVWKPESPKAVVLFSHGGGSWPEQYEKLAQWYVSQGFAVLAPLHTESMHMPEDRRASLQVSFGDRIADMATLAGYAQQTFAGLPLIASGHSYGSLFALMLGGALEYVAPIHNPAVKAVLTFSSPGNIPGLITPAAYTTLKVPLLMITGDADTVPGYVSDWHDHELPFNGTPVRESYELVVTGGDHMIAAGSNAEAFAMVTDVAGLFLAREVLGAAAPVTLPAGAKAELKTKA